MKDSATWYVYILQCSDGTLYSGATTDVARRLAVHNAGCGAKYTRTRLPCSVVYQEKAGTRSLALSREYAIKRLTRRQKLALIEAKGKEKGDASPARE